MPEVVSQAFDAGLFKLPKTPALGTSAVSGTWTVPVILVDFPDQPLTYANGSDWERALFDTTGANPTGSVFDYYQWVSGNRLRVVGKVVAVVHLDQPKAYYTNNSWGLSSTTPQNSAGMVLEALRKCDNLVNWSDYDRDLDGYVDMLWVLHAGLGGENIVTRNDFWSITSRLTSWSGTGAYITSDPVPGSIIKERVDRFSIVPEMSAFHAGSRSEIGVFCHEFGHALGLPDLYDTAPETRPYNVGPGCWSLMSTGVYGTDGASPQYPSHLGAWPMTFLGWRQPTRPTRDTLMTLAPIESGGDVLELWFQGESNPEHFLIENRQRLGFDRNAPDEGAIVYQVDDAAINSSLGANRVNVGPYPALRIIEGDGRADLFQGINHGDAGDAMPGSTYLVRWGDDTTPNTRSRLGNVTNVALKDITLVGDNLRFTAQVRSPGWQAARILSTPSFNPIPNNGPAPRATLLDGGSVVAVTSEVVAGIPQIAFRARHPDGLWDAPLTLSASSSGAVDPTVCAVPGGDVCVAWSDSRNGPHELYFRSRIRGVWTAERRLTDLPGFSRSPIMASDALGSIHLAWQYSDGSAIRIYFMRFTYLSPFGDPLPVTSGGVPNPPALAMAPNGSSYLVWMDQGSFPNGLWYSHFSPDSGMSVAHRLVQPQGGILPMVHATVDAQGGLNVLWAFSGGSGSELHYQRRLGITPAIDTALVTRGQPIQDFMMATDPSGTKHVVMEAVTSSSSQILYKAWHPSGGWDIGNTEVTLQSDGVAVRPTVVPLDGTSLTLLYTGYPQGVPSLVERPRNTAIPPLTAVTEPPPVGSGPTLRGAPNPLRAGARLRFLGRGEAPTRSLEIYDLSGRRVASASIVASSEGWQADIPGTETERWASGVYFARMPDRSTRLRIVVLR